MLQKKSVMFPKVSTSELFILHYCSKYALLLPTAQQETPFMSDKLHRHEALELQSVCRVFQRRPQTKTGSVI